MSTAVALPPSGSGTLEGLNEKVVPPGATVPLRFTVPVKLLKLVNVMVDVSDEPGVRVIVVGFRDMSKSGPATTVTVVVCVRNPLVPVTFTV